MAYAFKPFEKAVGSFVIGGVVVLVLAVIIMLQHQKGVAKAEYYTFFDSGAELVADGGMKVIYNGVLVGKTLPYLLLDNDRVKVPFFVLADYSNRVKSDTVAVLNISLMPGGSSLMLTKGSATAPHLEAGNMVYSFEDDAGIAILSNQKIMPPQRIDQIAKSLDDLLEELADPAGSLGTLLGSVNLLLQTNDGEIKSIMGSFSNIAKKIEKNGILSAMDSDNAMQRELQSSLITLDEMLQNFNELSKNMQTVKILGGSSKKTTSGGAAIEKNDTINGY